MGLRGPAPQPTQLKIMRGNPGRRPLNEREPRPEMGVPSCPRWLDKDARAEWRRVVPQLDKMGLIGKIDRNALALYCDAWSQFLSIRRILKEKGFSYILSSGYVQQRPEVAAYHKLQMMLRNWCHEFGMTPSARSRMIVNGKEEEEDPFDAYLLRKGS